MVASVIRASAVDSSGIEMSPSIDAIAARSSSRRRIARTAFIADSIVVWRA